MRKETLRRGSSKVLKAFSASEKGRDRVSEHEHRYSCLSVHVHPRDMTVGRAPRDALMRAGRRETVQRLGPPPLASQVYEPRSPAENGPIVIARMRHMTIRCQIAGSDDALASTRWCSAAQS